MNVCVVLGVGPADGLGARLCQRFAGLDMHVYVAGRTRSKLDKVVELIQADGGQANARVCDATDEAQVVDLFAQASEIGSLALAIYNVGNNTPGNILDMQAEYFLQSWKSGCYGGFLLAREAMRHMQDNGSGTILFTGASASLRGKANFGAFNSAKAALRTLAQALAKEAGPLGIHVGHVIVDGAINGDKIRSNFPEYADRLGDDGMNNLDTIVDAYEYLFKQSKVGWSFEVDLRTAIESW